MLPKVVVGFGGCNANCVAPQQAGQEHPAFYEWSHCPAQLVDDLSFLRVEFSARSDG